MLNPSSGRPMAAPSPHHVDDPAPAPRGGSARDRLLAGLPVTERRIRPAGVPTVVLRGGEGAPLVLLHNPGESAVNWMRVIPDLVRDHTVIAPDLPAHGLSGGAGDALDPQRALAWLGELIRQTCAAPPVLVGHVLGGAIAARFAARHGDAIRALVLVDTLGLAPFRPAPRFALAMIHFLARPGEGTYERFMRQCSYDLDLLRQQMDDRWEAFVSYNIQLARSPSAREAGRLMRELGFRSIPPEELARISVPTTLIWGRHDRANRLRTAEAAAARYGWPLHVIEHCADDPARDQPEAFLAALRAALAHAPQRGLEPTAEPEVG